MFPETVVVYDNVKHTALIVHHVDLRAGGDPQTLYTDAERAIDAVIDRIRGPRKAEPRHEPVEEPAL